MLALQRRRKILELLQEDGSARVSSLSRLFKVSEPTVRQDLARLEAEGFIAREHGGAFLKSVRQQVKSLSLQHLENMGKKTLIGRRAAELVQDGDSLILDSGSTTTEVAKNLEPRKNLKIVTNALNIALLLGTEITFEIMVTGGEFKPPTLSLTGEKGGKVLRTDSCGEMLPRRGRCKPGGGTDVSRAHRYPGEKRYDWRCGRGICGC